MTSWFDPERFARSRLAHGATWGRPVRLFESTPSTNDLALAALAGETKTGAVWLAREQTQGRGRRGNSWQSPPGENLTCSLLLRLPGPPEKLEGLSLLFGLAVRQLAQELVPQQTARVKWPNDVLLGDQKVAGILVETRSGADGPLGVVVGIGLNVHTLHFPPELTRATSLRRAGAQPDTLAFEDLLARLLRQIEDRFRLFLPRGLTPLLEELNQVDYLRGKRVRCGDVHGTACGIDARGGLILRDANGIMQTQRSGTIELLPSEGSPSQ